MEIFSLRQKIVIEAEKSKSAWYSLRRENESIIHKINMDSSLLEDQKELLLDFLKGHGDFIENCIADACALADDVSKNIEKFNQKKCYSYLRSLEPGAEVLSRNQGESQRKILEMIDKFKTKN